MEFGKVEYRHSGLEDGETHRTLCLTLIGLEDKDLLQREGLRALRLSRIMRLTREAGEQGCLLGYNDLSALLLSSLATLKRDVAYLEKVGQAVRLKRRKRNGNGKRMHSLAAEIGETGEPGEAGGRP
jgi:hypothetical protein